MHFIMTKKYRCNVLTPFSGYNPPQFIIDAAKDALNRVDCNQYAPTKVRCLRPSRNSSNYDDDRVDQDSRKLLPMHTRPSLAKISTLILR